MQTGRSRFGGGDVREGFEGFLSASQGERRADQWESGGKRDFCCIHALRSAALATGNV